jgi:hypothetical protein
LADLNYVTIDKTARPVALPEMKISGKKVRFFTDTILDTSSITAKTDISHIQTVFFEGSRFEMCLTASLSGDEMKSDCLSRGMFIRGALDQETLRAASRFLRGSDSLQPEEAESTSQDSWLFVGNGGFVYIGKYADRFERMVLIAMLSRTYVEILETQVKALSAAVREDPVADKSVALYEDMLTFNAGFYQRLPVSLEGHEVSTAWDAFSRSYRIDELREELDAQLSALALWVERDQAKKDADARERKQERDSRRVYRITTGLTLLSLLLTAISTPQETLAEKKDWLATAYDTVRSTIQ